MKAFFSKKQKHLMRERRKKKRMYERKAMAASTTTTDAEPMLGDEDKPKEDKKTVVQHVTDVGKGLSPQKTSSSIQHQQQRKRPHSSLSAEPEKKVDTNAKSSSSQSFSSPDVIIVPSNLSSRDAKKFRKDARRAARTEGRDETKLVFMTEKEQAALQQQQQEQQQAFKKRKQQQRQQHFPNLNQLAKEQKLQEERLQQEQARRQADQELPDEVKAQYVALDCEMVGVGSSGKQSALARASLTDWHGKVLMDSFVQVPLKVTDFRTKYSGVLPKHISSRNQRALTVEQCRKQVTDLLHGKILVGHALKNDLQALMLSHPVANMRDTAKYRPYQRLGGDGKYRPRKLRDLVAEHCDLIIQREGESHDSIDDARAAMELFKVSRVAWEAALERKQRKGGGAGGVGL